MAILGALIPLAFIACFAIQVIKHLNAQNMIQLAVKQKDRSRHVFMKNKAEEMGLHCHENALALPESFYDFRICKLGFNHIGTGRRTEIENVVCAQVDDTSIMIFDLSFELKHAFPICQTVALIQTPELELPEFDLQPENRNLLQDYDFEKSEVNFLNDPNFDSVYTLRSNSATGARTRFDRAVRDHLTANMGIYLEGRGDMLMMCFPESTIPTDELKNFFSKAFEIMALFTRKDVEPECVKKEIKAMLN